MFGSLRLNQLIAKHSELDNENNPMQSIVGPLLSKILENVVKTIIAFKIIALI